MPTNLVGLHRLIMVKHQLRPQVGPQYFALVAQYILFCSTTGTTSPYGRPKVGLMKRTSCLVTPHLHHRTQRIWLTTFTSSFPIVSRCGIKLSFSFVLITTCLTAVQSVRLTSFTLTIESLLDETLLALSGGFRSGTTLATSVHSGTGNQQRQ